MGKGSVRMNRFLLLVPLIFILFSPIPSHAFWFGLTEEEQSICRKRASKEVNEFSAKQTYDYCKQTIKKELKAKKKALSIFNAKEEKWNQCTKPFKPEIEALDARYESINNGTFEMKPPDKAQWRGGREFNFGTALEDIELGKIKIARYEIRKKIENTCGKKPLW